MSDENENKKNLVRGAGGFGVGAIVAGIPGAVVGAIVGILASKLSENKE